MTDVLDHTLVPNPRPGTGTVHPMSGYTGAEIGGVDLARPLRRRRPRRRAPTRSHRWKVVFFRDQHLGHAEQIAFARQFGELTYAHPYDDDPPEGFPEIYTVDPERYAAQYGIEGEAAKQLRRRYSYTNDWHTDVTAGGQPAGGLGAARRRRPGVRRRHHLHQPGRRVRGAVRAGAAVRRRPPRRAPLRRGAGPHGRDARRQRRRPSRTARGPPPGGAGPPGHRGARRCS